MAKIIYTYINPTSKKDLDEACRVLNRDGVIAYPTDVNWAFGCDPASKKAVDKIHMLKPHHPKELPFSFLCDSISMISSIADVDHFAFAILKKLFPGPFTVLLKRNKTLPRQMKDKRKVVGIRIPDCPLLIELIRLLGRPLATTSIPYALAADNPRDNEHLLHYGYEVDNIYGHALDLILDLGDPVPAQETTVIDLSEGEVVLVRQGIGSIKEFV